MFLAKSFKDKGQKVAVKRIPHVTTKQKRKNFQEIRFLKFCESHQNIIRYHRAFVVKEELWLVTEFVQGGTLTEVINFPNNSPFYIRRYRQSLTVAPLAPFLGPNGLNAAYTGCEHTQIY